MYQNNQDQENLARLRISSTQDWVQVAQEEEHRPTKPNTNKSPVQRCQRTPTDQRNRNPDNVRVPVKRPTLDQIRSGAAEPPQRTPQCNRHNTGIPINQPRSTRKQRKIVLEMLVVIV